MRDIICILLFVYMLVLLVRVFSSWIRTPPAGPARILLNIVYDLTEPVLRPLRNMLPPVQMGAVGFDLSPLIVFIIISVLQISIC